MENINDKEIKFNKKDLDKINLVLSKVTYKSNIHPALSLTRVILKNNKATFSSTNLSIGVVVDVNYIGNSIEKTFFIETESLCKAINSLPTVKDVVFLISEAFIEIKTLISNAKLIFQNGDDTPFIPEVDGLKGIIDSKIISNSINRVVTSASITNIKPELSSVFLNQKDCVLTSVATDAFHLAEFNQKTKDQGEFNILIPVKEASDISKIFSELGGQVEYIIGESIVCFLCENIKIVIKIVQGLFPDYNQIIPKEFTTTFIILKTDLDSSLKFLSQFQTDNNHIKIKTIDNTLVFESKKKDGSIGDFKISGSRDGDDFNGTFMANHLKTLVQSSPGESLVFKFTGIGKPVLITVKGSEDFRYLMMPLSV